MLKLNVNLGSRERDWGRFGERDNGSAEDGMAGRARRALSSARWDGAVATAQLGSVAARQL